MLDRLGVPGILALLVCVGSLLAVMVGAKPLIAGIAAAVAGIFVLTRLFRAGDA
ncbi:MAG TPA: hypothetical protein VNE39_13110 [Planctomycetota bacterium]|nr:hypothetical protein [Planctomycetota bacterium]